MTDPRAENETNGCIIITSALDLIIRPSQIPARVVVPTRKVDELRDSVRFRTDAGMKVGHGNRGVNEQTQIFSVEASSIPRRNRNCLALFVQQIVIKLKQEAAECL